MFRRERSDSVPPRVMASFAKVAVRSGGPCTNAGPPRVARPARTVHTGAASRPKVVKHAGISKARIAVAQPMSRVVRAPGRGPKITAVARPTIAVRKAKPAPVTRRVVQAKHQNAEKPATGARQLPKVAPRKSPPVGPPPKASAKRPPAQVVVARQVVARKGPPMLAQGDTVREAVQRGAALPAEARTRRQNRPSIGSNFASHAELEQAKQGRAVDELMALMPPSVAAALLGGGLATEQMPDPKTREALVRQTVALKAGPDGATVANAVRAWHAYTEFAALHKLPNQGLPGSAAFVASFLKSEATRAAAGRGSQGGTSVPNSRRVGLLWLHEKLGFPLQVDSLVVLAAANPSQIRAHRRADPVNRRRKQAGSMPIACYAQFETLASSPIASPARYFARSMCAFVLAMSVRAVDALRTVEDADEEDPISTMSGWSYFSKDGEPMRTFAPAAGFLGDYPWWPEHAVQVRAARPFPKWAQAYGSGGRVTEASGPPLPYVMPKAHMVASIKACLMQQPLQLSEAEFKELGLTAHSEHGSPSDMLATIGPHSHFGSFIREDVREIGHWLRLGKLEEQLEGGTAGAQGRRRGAPAGRQATGAFGNDAAECAARYCEGEGREGRRAAQMRVRKSWIRSVRMALSQWARPWTELPRGRADYRILEADPPNE